MPEKGASDRRIRFGSFEADLQTKELFKEGSRVPLANQSFVALATLLERPGQLVSREELQQRLWPDDRVVEFDQGLNAIINRLRDALGAGPDGAGLIETLPRRGYRFIGTLNPEPGEPGGQPAWMGQLAQADRPASVQQPQIPPGQRRIGLAIVVGTLVMMLALLGWAIAAWLTYVPHAQPTNLKMIPVTSLEGREVAPVFNSAGDTLLFAWNGAPDAGGHFDLYSRGVDSERLARLTHVSALAMHAAWAPSGDQLALARQADHDSGVFLVPRDGAPERLLAAANFLNESFMQLSWSPDGRRVAYAAVESDGWSHIDLAEVTGSEKHSLARPSGCADAGTPAFSPDGRWLAFVCTSSIAVYNVAVTDLKTNTTRMLLSLQGNPQGLAWTLQGEAILVANESDTDSGIWRITLNGQSSRLFHSEGPLGPGIAVAGRGIAFVRESNVIDIWRADLGSASTASENLISSTRTQLVPAYSPDGAHIVFQSTRSGSPEIWLADADGRNPVKLTSFNGPLTGAPSWCQDGRRIAFDSRASGSSAIYVLDVFEGRPRKLETTQANLSLPTWSPDCRWIVASNGRTALYRVPAEGGRAESFTEKRAWRAVAVDSGVIFNVVEDTDVKLWSKPVQGGVEAPLEGMASLRYSDSWAATPRGVYYTAPSAGAFEVRFYDFATHATHVVRTLESPPEALGGLGLAVSADEHWLLYTRSDRSESDIMMVEPEIRTQK
jgi:Tol biopolymer transport system component/DNA-binding winged helix-turn-helix (wHTH) protein